VYHLKQTGDKEGLNFAKAIQMKS
jgi:DNA repair protein RadC